MFYLKRSDDRLSLSMHILFLGYSDGVEMLGMGHR
jgi:hypothetical protein